MPLASPVYNNKSLRMLWKQRGFFLHWMYQTVKILPNIFSSWYAWGLRAGQDSPNTDLIHTGKNCFDHSSVPCGKLVENREKWEVAITVNKRDLLSAERRMIWSNCSCTHTYDFIMFFIIQNCYSCIVQKWVWAHCLAFEALHSLPAFFPCENKHQWFVELAGRRKRSKKKCMEENNLGLSWISF